jgi:hypothetical protein
VLPARAQPVELSPKSGEIEEGRDKEVPMAKLFENPSHCRVSTQLRQMEEHLRRGQLGKTAEGESQREALVKNRDHAEDFAYGAPQICSIEYGGIRGTKLEKGGY